MTDQNPYRCSSLSRRYACPGSARLEALCPEETSEEAESGDRIHLALKEGRTEWLDDEERELYERCEYFLSEKSILDDGRDAKITRERAVHLNHGDDIVTSGTCDVAMVWPGARSDLTDGFRVAVIDWKTGWSGVEPRAATFQLSAYLAALMQRQGALTGDGWIYQPRLHSSRRVLHLRLTGDQVPGIAKAVADIRERCARPGLTLNPTPDGCRYCRARFLCPALQVEGAELEVIEQTETALAAVQLNRLYSMWQIVKQHGAAVEKAMRAALDAGVDGLDYEYIETQGNREVDPVEAFEKIVPAGYPPKDFLRACCKVSVPKFEKHYGKESLANVTVSRGNPRKSVVRKSE